MSALEQVASRVRHKLKTQEKKKSEEIAIAIVERFDQESTTTVTGDGHLSPEVISALQHVHVVVENKEKGTCNCDPRESCSVCEAPAKQWVARMILEPTMPHRKWAYD